MSYAVYAAHTIILWDLNERNLSHYSDTRETLFQLLAGGIIAHDWPIFFKHVATFLLAALADGVLVGGFYANNF